MFLNASAFPEKWYVVDSMILVTMVGFVIYAVTGHSFNTAASFKARSLHPPDLEQCVFSWTVLLMWLRLLKSRSRLFYFISDYFLHYYIDICFHMCSKLAFGKICKTTSTKSSQSTHMMTSILMSSLILPFGDWNFRSSLITFADCSTKQARYEDEWC